MRAAVGGHKLTVRYNAFTRAPAPPAMVARCARSPLHPPDSVCRAERNKPRRAPVALGVAALGTTGAADQQAGEGPELKVQVIDAKGNPVGEVQIKQLAHGAPFIADLEGLPPGGHGFQSVSTARASRRSSSLRAAITARSATSTVSTTPPATMRATCPTSMSRRTARPRPSSSRAS